MTPSPLPKKLTRKAKIKAVMQLYAMVNTAPRLEWINWPMFCLEVKPAMSLMVICAETEPA